MVFNTSRRLQYCGGEVEQGAFSIQAINSQSLKPKAQSPIQIRAVLSTQLATCTPETGADPPWSHAETTQRLRRSHG